MLEFDDEPFPDSARTNAWMITLVDLVSLLLSFFILVYAASSLPLPAWNATGVSLRTAFGGPADARPQGPMLPARSPASADATANTAYLASVIDAALANDPAIAGQAAGDHPAGSTERRSNDGWQNGMRRIIVDALGERLVIALPRERVFYPQSGQIVEEAAGMLAAIVPHLGRIGLPNIVAVEAGDDEGERMLAFERGRAMLAALRARGAAAAPVFIIPERGDDGRRPVPPCSAVADLDFGRAVVICLAGDAR